MATTRMLEVQTPLGSDLVINQFSGEESLGRLFEFRVDMLSERNDIKPSELLGQRITVKLEQADGEARFFNGYVARYAQSGFNGRYYTSQAIVRPWLWFLTRRTDCRIFQKMKVPDILEKVFADYAGVASVDASKLRATYRDWDYCVQYRESDFNFISRLMEHEGIYYYFEHSETEHKMILVDEFDVHEAVPGFEQIRHSDEDIRSRSESEYVSQWQHAQEIRSGRFTTQDYDFEVPLTPVTADESNIDGPALSEAQVFDYPGGYVKRDDGTHYATVRLEELQSAFEAITAISNSRSLRAGAKFTLVEHKRDDQNGDYTITRATFQGVQNSSETAGGEGDRFGVTFSAIPYKQQFRPRRSTTKPVVQGPQTAVVVGPSGEEIYVDKYGRVKVHFHWDRHDKHDENSSCWVRVSHPWAGKQWGMIAHPRIGQEVIVEFLEGDPDQPIITGRVYNADQMPPYELPANMTQTGIKTRSSKGADPSFFNEIRFEDKKGAEQFVMHAQKDMLTQVENDETKAVEKNSTTNIGVNTVVNIGGNLTQSTKGNQSSTLGGNQTLTVLGTKTETVTGAVTQTWKAAGDIMVGTGLTENIGSKYDLKVTGPMKVQVLGPAERLVTGAIKETASAAMDIHSDGAMTITAGGGMSLGAPNFTFVASGKLAFYGSEFNRTINQGNDMILGPNSNAYMGMASDTKIGSARSTFVGLFQNTTVSAGIYTDLGLKMGAVVGVLLEKKAAVEINEGPVDIAKKALALDQSGMKVISGGGGGGGGGGGAGAGAAATAQVVAAVAGGVGAAALGISDVVAAIKAYKDAGRDVTGAMAAGAAIGGGIGALGGPLGAAAGAGLGSLIGLVGGTMAGTAGDSAPAPAPPSGPDAPAFPPDNPPQDSPPPAPATRDGGDGGGGPASGGSSAGGGESGAGGGSGGDVGGGSPKADGGGGGGGPKAGGGGGGGSPKGGDASGGGGGPKAGGGGGGGSPKGGGGGMIG